MFCNSTTLLLFQKHGSGKLSCKWRMAKTAYLPRCRPWRGFSLGAFFRIADSQRPLLPQPQQRSVSTATKKSQSTTALSFRQRILPYIYLTRIHRPIGIWLLYFPCAWSIQMASFSHCHWTDAKMLALFLAGATVMRSAGCTINDLWDRKIDAQASMCIS